MFNKIILFLHLLCFAGITNSIEETQLTKEERIEFISKLEIEFEKQILEDISLSPDEVDEMREYVAYLKEKESWPMTLTEAVDIIISTTPKKNIPIIMATPKEELSKYHLNWGQGIRNAFGLWKGNPELTSSVCGIECHPDDVSMKIIEAVWSELHNKGKKIETKYGDSEGNEPILSIESLMNFALSYKPCLDGDECHSFFTLPEVPPNVSNFLDKNEINEEFITYNTLIMLKLYRAQLEQAHQSYEIRDGKYGSNHPILTAFKKYSGNTVSGEFVSSSISYMWAKTQDKLKGNALIKNELNRIEKELNSIEKGVYWN
jgi:hypothetical protein